jgi:DNA-binding GntR family transcriptional regulator
MPPAPWRNCVEGLEFISMPAATVRTPRPRNSTAAGTGRRSLADAIYEQLKSEVFDFRLLPGDRFSESELADRLHVSRTPVREALYRMEREGYMEVHFKSGWSVAQIDFKQFENLYDLRLVLESEAVRRICAKAESAEMDKLAALWLVAPEERVHDSARISKMDESFHSSLLEIADNPEMSRVHHEITEKVRIIRRLGFSGPERVGKSYEEHGAIIKQILRHRADQAVMLLKSHIELSKAQAREITLHHLSEARQRLRPRKLKVV